MSLWQATFLGVMQGLAEFLPVSSSGHLVLVPWLLGWPIPGLEFDLVVHVGTLIAVVVYLRADVYRLLLGLLRLLRTGNLQDPDARLALWLVIGSVPGALVGALLESRIEAVFSAPVVVALLLVVTGLLLFVSERLGKQHKDMSQMTFTDALLIGVAQAVAILPGISRSGATLSVGLQRGLTREEAGRFAFLLAMPITAGAAVFGLRDVVTAGFSAQVPLLVVGMLASAISGYLAIHGLLTWVRRHSLVPFSYYCWAMALLCLVVGVVR